MAKQLKQMLAAQVLSAMKGADGAVFVNVSPMTVETSSRFRTFLKTKAGGARLRVLHNRTARHALTSAGWPASISKVLKGPTAVIYGGDGTAGIAKSLTEWTRTDKTLVVKGAIAEGEYYDAKAVTATLAKMPNKQTLRAMIAGVVSSGARGLAVTIAGPGAALARVLQARIDKQGSVPQGSGESAAS
jgi:large subunit ribosomal protein L10